MCTSYKAGRDIDFRALFDVDSPPGVWPEEIYKDYLAPIVLCARDGTRQARLASFGFVPRRHIGAGIKAFETMNCRMETVATKRAFSSAWAAGQYCLIPCNVVYEPNYETGKCVRWGIHAASGQPFALAGLWRAWDEPGGIALSFTMLTLNADDHPLMRRFHKPGTEKRSVAIVPRMLYGEWLTCRDPEVARTYLTLYPPAIMAAEAAPPPPREARTAPHAP